MLRLCTAGLIELAVAHNVLIGGDDFKSGQTKMKSVLVDFLVGAGLKPTSIVSYNHLGNNDGMNLSAPQVRGAVADAHSYAADYAADYGGRAGPDFLVSLILLPVAPLLVFVAAALYPRRRSAPRRSASPTLWTTWWPATACCTSPGSTPTTAS